MGSTGPEVASSLVRAIAAFEHSIHSTQHRWLTPRAPGAWSPAQITEHVILISESISRLIYLLQQPTFPELPKHTGVYQDGKKQAPSYAVPGAGSSWEDLQPRWEKVHHRLVQTVEGVQDWDNPRTFPHPFFGELTLLQWVQMAAIHLLHHRRQMQEAVV